MTALPDTNDNIVLSEALNIGYEAAAEFFRSRDDFCVVTHANPDGDTLGSAAALVLLLRRIGKRAFSVCADPIPKKFDFIDRNGVFAKSVPETVGTVVSVDVASKAMLGGYSFFVEDGKSFDLSVDHHSVNTIPCKRRLIKADYIANGEIIYELMRAMNEELDRDIATALYAAICSDSGGFRYCATRAETYEYAADMIRAGADFAYINRQLFECKTFVQIALERAAYEALEFYFEGKLAIVAIDETVIERCGADESDFESINQIPRQVEGVAISALLRPRKGEIKISLRSNEDIDVAAFAKAHGGGGHYHAAGYRHSGTLDEAKAVLIKDLKSVFANGRG